MGKLHEDIAVVLLVVIVILVIVNAKKCCTKGKESVKDSAPDKRKAKKLAEEDEDTIDFVNFMFEGEAKPSKGKVSKAVENAMFDAEDGQGMSQVEKNKLRKKMAENKKQHKLISQQKAMEEEEAVASEKSKKARKKVRAKEKKKQQNKGKAGRDLSKLVTSREQFEEEIAQTRKEFENGNDRTYAKNKSLLGNMVQKQGDKYSEKVGKEKAIHKAKPVVRGGGAGLI